MDEGQHTQRNSKQMGEREKETGREKSRWQTEPLQEGGRKGGMGGTDRKRPCEEVKSVERKGRGRKLYSGNRERYFGKLFL